jgi:hypothetical protein
MRSFARFRSKPIAADLALLFGLALLIRLLAAWPQQQPSYFDALYYYVDALNLAARRGFVEDFVWNYLGQPGPLPQPSHLYWMPLTSILAWLGMMIGGATYRAAQLPFVVLSALLAPISYWTAYGLTGRRWPGWLAGLLAIFSGFYFPFWTAIDNFTPFGVFGSLALLMAGWHDECGMMNDESKRRDKSKVRPILWSYLITAGALVGLAHLARADGPLLLVAIVLVGVKCQVSGVRRQASRSKNQVSGVKEQGSALTHYVLRFTFYVLLGYLLIMTPWFWRNWQVVGTPWPVSGSQTVWLTDYDDLFSYNKELSLYTFLAQGVGFIVRGRWWALTNNLQTVLAVWGMIFVAPLALVGGWRLRQHSLIQVAGWYGLLLFAAMTLIFAFPGVRGGLFHSGAALLPFIYSAAVVGLEQAVEWVAARRRGWQTETARRVFGIGMIVMAVGLSTFIYYQRVLRNNSWNSADALYPAIVAWVTEQDPQAIVMIGNPPAYRYHGGGLSVVVPNEDMETTLAVAAYYQVDYLILDRNHPAPLAGLYNHPTDRPGLSLVQTFGQGDKIYVFKVE